MKNTSIVATVVLVNYNTESLLHEAIGALRIASKNIGIKIVVIDNASRDNSVEIIRRDFSDCTLIVNTENVGFGRANNQAIPHIEGDYALLLNTDAFVAPDTLTKSLDFLDKNSTCGILGVRLVGRDAQFQPSARYFPTPLSSFLYRTGLISSSSKHLPCKLEGKFAISPVYCDWVPGCYYLIRRTVIDKIGLFDPRYFLYFEEIDYCFAVKKNGWEVVYFPQTTVIHIGGESAKADGVITDSGRQLQALQIESELLYFRKNLGIISVLNDLILSTVFDLFITLKRLFKLDLSDSATASLRHLFLIWKLAVSTRLGAYPTR